MKNLVDKQVFFNGERIYLRTLKTDDASEKYASWLNDKEVNKYLETRQTSVKDLEEYIKEKNRSEHALFLGIFWSETSEHIGNVKLEPVENGRGTMGIMIGEKDFWSKGLGTEASNLMVQYAFEELNLNEVNLGVISKNKAAIRVYEKCGFEIYKVHKNAIDHDGIKYDQVWMRAVKS